MQQAFLERMQHSTGYGGRSSDVGRGSPGVPRQSEPLPAAPGSGLRLSVQPLKSPDLQQAHTQQTLQRVLAVETALKEVTSRVDDLTEVTRTSLADVRSEIGAVKLEQRFSQGMHNPAGDASSASAPQFISEEIKRKFEEASRNNDRLESLIKEEQGRRALLFARLEAVEASCQDLRAGQQELADMPEATTQMLRGEVSKQVERMRVELDVALNTSEQQGMIVSRAEKSADEMSRRIENLETSLRDLQEMQGNDAASLRARIEAAVRECDRQMAAADELSSSVRDGARRCDSLEDRLELVERGRGDALREEHSDMAAKLDTMDFALQELKRSLPSSKVAPEVESLRQDMFQELAAVRGELEQYKAEQAVCVARTEVASKREDDDRRLLELKQDHLSEIVALRGRIEEIIGELHAQQATMGTIEGRVDEEKHRRSADLQALRGLLEHLERQSLMTEGKEGRSVVRVPSSDPALASRVDALEQMSSQAAVPKELESRLKALEQAVAMDQTSKTPAGVGAGACTAAELQELRASILQSHNDLGKLAVELQSTRDEQDQAISNLGSLTELVAKTAAAGIQRAEERIAADLTGKQQEIERTAAASRFQMEKDAKALIAEVKNVIAAGGVRGLGAGQNSAAKTSPEGDGRIDAALRRIEGIAKELRSEATAQADAADARVAAVEASFGLDLKRLRGMLSTCVSQLESMQVELSQLELQKFSARLQAVETSVGVRGRSAMKEQPLASNSRTTSHDDTSSDRRNSWLSTLGKVMPDYNTPVWMCPKPLQAQQAGLKDKLSNIASSVHQVLGALENDDEHGTVVTTISAMSDGSVTPRVPSISSCRSFGGQSAGQFAARLRGVSVDPHSEDLRSGQLSPQVLGRCGGGHATPGMGLGAVVASACGGSCASMAAAGRSARGSMTAPQSSGPSRDRSPQVDHRIGRPAGLSGAASPPPPGQRLQFGTSMSRTEGSIDRSRHLAGNSTGPGGRVGQQQQFLSPQSPTRATPMPGQLQSGRTSYVPQFQR
eukprot:TRINITY_DN22285_c0_g1_i1.p1 TRINITY_DN22285_c0_g1~~TRINITY_DN22285_c0_g1_i1.p1  ORF type:complete len:1017 (-),score=216.77 TRINITY_DN22285_c0_g1_i1:120-3170(-)